MGISVLALVVIVVITKAFLDDTEDIKVVGAAIRRGTGEKRFTRLHIESIRDSCGGLALNHGDQVLLDCFAGHILQARDPTVLCKRVGKS